MGVSKFAVCLLLLIATANVETAVAKLAWTLMERVYKSSGSGPSVDIGCVTTHCLTQSFGCLASSECRNAMSCSQKCLKMWDNDTTHDKVVVQNCSNACSFTYGGKAYENFMECVTDNNCISFPPIPNTCRGPNVHPQKMLTLKDMQGSWWVVKGYNPVYDCYPCQYLSIAPINQTTWAYQPKYQVHLKNGTLFLVSQLMLLPNTSAPGANISFIYHDMGLDHHETWWLLDKAVDASYLTMYYCGNTLQWYYEGALVLARDRALDESVYPNIATSFQKAVGLSLNDFCDVNTSTSCPD